MTTSKEGLLKDKVVSLVNGATVFQDEKSAYINAILRLITTYGIEAQQQGAVNAITQFKVARINHTMSRPVQEWETEFDTATKTLVDYIAELTKLKGEK